MTTFIITLLAKLLDPVSLLIASVWGYKTYHYGLKHLLIIALLAGILIEFFLFSTQAGRNFGQGIGISYIACYIHAFIGWIIAHIKHKRISSDQT